MMRTADYFQNLAILLFVLIATFGVWYFSETWWGAWTVLIILLWTTPSSEKG